MKKLLGISVILIASLVTALVFISATERTEEIKSEIEETVLKAYIHGAFNELNPDAMSEGFHPDFAIFSADGENISKYPIASWVDGVRKRKNKPLNFINNWQIGRL